MNRFSYPSHRRGSVRGWVIGCLSVFLIFVLLIAIGVFYVVRNARSLIASATQSVLTKMVDQSQLPPDQKAKIKVHVNRVVADVKSGKITQKDLERIAESMSHSPLIPLGMVYVAQEKYVNPSSLSPDAKADAVLQFERLVRGVFEKKIPQEAIEEVAQPLLIQKPNGQKELKPAATQVELEAVITAAKARADAAGVPVEHYRVDIADEIGKAIDRALDPNFQPLQDAAPEPDAEPERDHVLTPADLHKPSGAAGIEPVIIEPAPQP